MGDAARQLAHGFHLLCLAQLVFGRDKIVDIIDLDDHAAVGQTLGRTLMPSAKAQKAPAAMGQIQFRQTIGEPFILSPNGALDYCEVRHSPKNVALLNSGRQVVASRAQEFCILYIIVD
jgi:hypothetical protein